MTNKMTFKRVAAIIGIVLLAGMYISTLVFALIGSDLSNRLLMISMISTIAIPIVIHFIIMFYRIGHKDDAADTTESDETSSDDRPE